MKVNIKTATTTTERKGYGEKQGRPAQHVNKMPIECPEGFNCLECPYPDKCKYMRK